MPRENRSIRCQGNPSYGVTLVYSDDGKSVVGRSHFPHIMVNTECLHYGKYEPQRASPVADEFVEYWSAMQCTIDRLDADIAMLEMQRDALTRHLESSMMLGAISNEGVE